MSSRFMAPQACLSVGLAFRQASSAQERTQVRKKPGDGPQHPVTSPEFAGELAKQKAAHCTQQRTHSKDQQQHQLRAFPAIWGEMAGSSGKYTTERTDHEDIDPKPRRS